MGVRQIRPPYIICETFPSKVIRKIRSATHTSRNWIGSFYTIMSSCCIAELLRRTGLWPAVSRCVWTATTLYGTVIDTIVKNTMAGIKAAFFFFNPFHWKNLISAIVELLYRCSGDSTRPRNHHAYAAIFLAPCFVVALCAFVMLNDVFRKLDLAILNAKSIIKR